jgi:hypothetical protein
MSWQLSNQGGAVAKKGSGGAGLRLKMIVITVVGDGRPSNWNLRGLNEWLREVKTGDGGGNFFGVYGISQLFLNSKNNKLH